ncbi:radical SAM protein [Tepidanaerobacter syntrophicus]|uniref:radical SAM protein n=1 Tax=Tepidanaerobacter syntrophicus TaxID=224999 RepID=UPI0022EFCDDF|nr:radical SAM protein [Tepidanaerobacter syntrophicus]GLI50710.1 radical SAM protein [Tepidanaerobacter syntrophicus]
MTKNILKECKLCPFCCGVDRTKGQKGVCKAPGNAVVSKYFVHKWEEPCISGENGSGTVFFTHCNLKCVFCQNFKISQEGAGREVSITDLAEIFLELQQNGVNNINLVTPTIYSVQIIESVKFAKEKGLALPIVWNSNAYERVETLKMLTGLVDVYLPDLKYFSDDLALKYSAAPGYFDIATQAILEMFSQVGEPVFDGNGIIKKGLVIRHLVLPGHVEDSKKVLQWISANLPKGVYVSIMSQYAPYYKAKNYPEINKTLSKKEYDEVIDYFFELGLENGYIQEEGAASDEYVPDFDE